MFGWTSRQRNVAIASFLSWTLDAFDFFLLVFLLSDIATSYFSYFVNAGGEADRRIAVWSRSGEVWPQTGPDG
jgi:hypothetical protein